MYEKKMEKVCAGGGVPFGNGSAVYSGGKGGGKGAKAQQDKADDDGGTEKDAEGEEHKEESEMEKL